jgi:hypothetical protein
LKWVGLVGCAGIAAGFVLSAIVYVRYDYKSADRRCYVSLDPRMGAGVTWVRVCVLSQRDNLGLWQKEKAGLDVSLHKSHERWQFYWRPAFDKRSDRSATYVDACVPFWLPFLVLSLPTAFLWYADRPSRTGYCWGCGYDLTGNTSGTCPECGEATALPNS